MKIKYPEYDFLKEDYLKELGKTKDCYEQYTDILKRLSSEGVISGNIHNNLERYTSAVEKVPELIERILLKVKDFSKSYLNSMNESQRVGGDYILYEANYKGLRDYTDSAFIEYKKQCDLIDEDADFWQKTGDWFEDCGAKIAAAWDGLWGKEVSIEKSRKRIMEINDITKKRLDKIQKNLNATESKYQGYAETLTGCIIDVKSYINILKLLSGGNVSDWNSILFYPMLSKIYSDIIEKLKTVLVGNSPAYANDPPYYGGNQSNAKKRWINGDREELRKVVKKYYPKYTDEEIEEFLIGMAAEGCGYMALTNTIFARFAGKEQEFEEIFGFPMCDENGNPNYDLVMVDLYCSEDNKNSEGTSIDSREDIWENYLNDRGVKVDVVNHDKLTVEKFEELSTEGEIIVAVRPIRLRDENGKMVDDRDGGHAMVVTGVTEDGMLIVSSWGKKYYIDPKDYADIEKDGYGPGDKRFAFQQVKYG